MTYLFATSGESVNPVFYRISAVYIDIWLCKYPFSYRKSRFGSTLCSSTPPPVERYILRLRNNVERDRFAMTGAENSAL